MSSRDHQGRERHPGTEQIWAEWKTGVCLKFPHHPYKLAAPTSDDHNFPVRTPIYAFLDSMKISLSLEFNKMKSLAKTWAEQLAGSQTVEERSVLVFQTFF